MPLNIHKKVWGVFIVVFLLAGCSVDKNPTISKTPAPEVTKEVVGNYAPPLTTATLKISANSLTSYEELHQTQPTTNSSVAGSQDVADEVYRFDNGFHIWEGNITFPEMEDIWEMSYIRKIQFRDKPGGVVLVASDNANFMYTFTNIKGKYGFGRSAPESGVIFDHSLEGEWTGMLNGTPTLRGTGEYARIWKGYYNQELTEIETRVDFQIQDLQFTRNAEHGYLLTGTIVASLPPFSFQANFDGTPTAKISIYQFGLKVGEVEVEIPNLYGWDIKNGLINPNAAEFFETVLDPLNLLAGMEPLAN